MGHEVPRLLLEYRELPKLKSTYVDVLPAYVNPDTGRIHTSFNQDGRGHRPAVLLRPQPAEHPGPHPARRGDPTGFVPAPGCRFVVADYSQIELRLMAHLSGDPAFIEAFEQGGDIHRQTAAIIFGVPLEQVTAEMRARAKTINFATIYGQGAVRAVPAARHHAGRGEGVHPPVLRALRRGARLPRPHHGRGAGAGLRRDALRPAALHPRDRRTGTSTCGPSASAPPRTRRCRARPPT